MISAQLLMAIALLCQNTSIPHNCKAEILSCYVQETGNSRVATDSIPTKCITQRFK